MWKMDLYIHVYTLFVHEKAKIMMHCTVYSFLSQYILNFFDQKQNIDMKLLIRYIFFLKICIDLFLNA